jgi:hypothetical protein
MTNCLQVPRTESGGVRVATPGADSDQTTDRLIVDEDTKWHDTIARVPEQRGREPAQSGGRARDARGRFIKVHLATPLLDPVVGQSPVPGGHGAPSPMAFTFAGIDWTPSDAGIDGSPIGFRLASELHQAARSPRSSHHVDADGTSRGQKGATSGGEASWIPGADRYEH